MNTKRGTPQGPTTRSQPIDQTNTASPALSGAVKNAKDAKNHLLTTGWVAPGEQFAIETMARVLLALVANTARIPQPASTVITSVAHILTEKLEEGIMADMADKISLHINETLTTLTSDLHNRLDQQVKAITETAQSQATLTVNLLKAQEKMDESTQNVLKRTYSQVTATATTATPTYTQTQHQPLSADQIRLRNREEIKKRQVLIEFDRNQDLQLENMSEVVLARKAKDAINTVWAASPEPKPSLPKVRAAVLLRSGGLLLELDSAAAAEWMCNDANRASVLANIGSGASIKNRSYQVIVQFIPVQFDPNDDEMHRQFEEVNDLQPNSVLKTEWIKPIKDRRESQRVATARFYLKDAKSANVILSKGAYMFGRKVVPKKPSREPIRCLKCQLFGHERRHCASTEPRCARCAMNHETEDCGGQLRTLSCRNCEGHHASYDRECPKFIEKCAQLDARCPENRLAFYPTDEPWSWATKAVNVNHGPHLSGGFDAQNQGYVPAFRTGSNNWPIGRQYPPRPQSAQDTFQ